MKEKEIEIERFKTIEELYEFFDKNSILLDRNSDLRDIWAKYQKHTKSDIEKQKAQWEIESFCFSFYGDKVFSFSYSNGKNSGEIRKYPDLDEFQEAAFNYLITRAKKAKSNFLLARYNHLLWVGLKKNRNYAIEAIDYYIKAINDYCQLIIKDNHHENHFQIGRLYENLVSLCNEIKTSSDKLKEITAFLLTNVSVIEISTASAIIKDMLDYPKLFKANDFENVLPIFEDYINQKTEKRDDSALIGFYLPIAIRVAQKINKDIKKWHNQMGLAYLRAAEKETEANRNWIKLGKYSDAISEFLLAGNEEKKKETEQLYFELKPKVKLETISVDFDEQTIALLKGLNNELKIQAEDLLTNSPEVIYRTIARGVLFPKYTNVLKASQNKENSFLDTVTTSYFDNNKNISKRKPGENDKHDLFQTYKWQLQGTLLPFLHYVIVGGIKSGHLTYKNFLEHLVQNTWIGKPYEEIDLGGEIKTTNWVKLVAPSIVNFFVQVQSLGESKYYVPDFILCIDSLTLKIEGLFRNFSERLNISTSIGKKKGTQEVLLYDIIDNEIIRKYFDEDDMLLFEYVFSNEGGLNLRNNIAHSFYREDQYNPDFMLLLIAVLLRIGKYDTNSTKKNEPEQQEQVAES